MKQGEALSVCVQGKEEEEKEGPGHWAAVGGWLMWGPGGDTCQRASSGRGLLLAFRVNISITDCVGGASWGAHSL